MPAFVTRLFLVSWLLGGLAAALTGEVQAQPSPPRGANGPISRQELRARVAGQQLVRHAIIQGDDLLAIMRETTFTIAIENCIIEGGLDFTTLPALAAEHPDVVKALGDEGKAAWIERQFLLGYRVHDIPVVANILFINATEIRPPPSETPEARPLAVNARATLFQHAIFQSVIFQGEAHFEEAIFSGQATFASSHFHGLASFEGASFSRGGFFLGAWFNDYARFGDTRFRAEANFTGARFTKGVHFGKARFNHEATFAIAVFGIEGAFIGTHFTRDAQFRHARFDGEAIFDHTTFSRDAIFSGVVFDRPTSYESAQFSGEALFPAVRFAHDVTFLSARFEAVASFWRMTAEKAAVFTDARFSDRAIFRRARFNQVTFDPEHDLSQRFPLRYDLGATQLSPAIFFNRVDFREATFADAHFSGVSFEEVDLTGARFTDRPEAGGRFTGTLTLTDATYRRLMLDDLDFTILGSPNPESLRRLEDNFRASGQLELANEAFYQRKRGERRVKSSLVRVGELILLDWPAGYGVRPVNTLGVSAGLIVCFAIIYHAADVVRYRMSPRDANFRFRLTDIPILSRESEKDMVPEEHRPQRSRRQRMGDALTFSVSVYTKLGTGRRVARKWPGVVIAEWVLGLLMFAVFFYTLSNTVPVIQRLLSAVV